MKELLERESSIPTPLEQVDWSAVEYLQQRREKSPNDYTTDALEYAIDKALESTSRKATGATLAKDLFRDGKRQVARRLNPKSRIGKRIVDYPYLELPPFDFIPDEVPPYLHRIIHHGFSALSKKELHAIYIKAIGVMSQSDIKQVLGVSLRQYRNILKSAQMKLRVFPGFKHAFFLAFLETDLTEYNEFIAYYLTGRLALLKAI